jgi:ubiquinone/menaquinone biosynthesis C-methylase UbiE
MPNADTAFAGSIPERYDQFLGPLLFQPYAGEVAARVSRWKPDHILETAAGTGIVTEAIQRAAPSARIVATDLNQAMLDIATRRIKSDRVCFQVADAQHLPFADDSFDLVVCQFGVMFFPDKPKANSEAHRVLKDGGRYLLVIWDTLDRNPVSQTLAEAVAAEFPADPPRFLERAPFGYADRDQIKRDMRAGGFTGISIDTVELHSRVSAGEAARGMCLGSPLTAEIEERGKGAVERATAAGERALQKFDGQDVPMSAIFATGTK